MESGVATRPIADLAAYREALRRDGVPLGPHHAPGLRGVAARSARRIVFAEGEDERVLQAAAAMLEETDDKPILIGRPEVIDVALPPARPDDPADRDFELVNPESDARYRDYWQTYHELMARQRRVARHRPRRHAHQHHRHRRRHGPSRRGGVADLRHLRRSTSGT